MTTRAWLVVVLAAALGCTGSNQRPKALPAASLVFRAPQGFGQYWRKARGAWILASPETLTVNAEMTVECRDRSGKLMKKWTGPTQWDGPVPSSYGTSVWPARVIDRITDIDTSSVRVGVNANGTGGTTLQKWMPKGCVSVSINIEPIHPAGDAAGGSAAFGDGNDDGGGDGDGDNRRGRAGGSKAEKRGNLTREQGGVESANARPSGQAHGDPEGAMGGEGSYGDRGARGAMALFGGLVGVPAAIRPAVEVALIIEEANLLGAGKNFIKHRLKTISGVLRGRELVFQSAQGYAYKARRALERELLKDAKFAKLPTARQQHALNVIEWKVQEGYFESVRQAAEAELRHLDELIPELEKAYAKRASVHIKHQLNIAKQHRKNAEDLLEATQVKPVAGSLPINHAYAGKELPLNAETVKALKSQGIDARSVPFSPDGYPDFSRWAVADVRIKLTGKHPKDVALAKKVAKLPKALDNYTWHHHQELGRMQLVPGDLHEKIGHTGGRATYRHATGNPNAYRRGR